MSVGPLAVEIVLTFCLAAALLHRYGDWRRDHVFVTVPVLIAWYFSFTIIVMLPMDVSSTTYRQCLMENAPPVLPTPSWEEVVLPTANITVFMQNSSIIKRSIHDEDIIAGNVAICKEPWSYISNNALRNLWRIVYWTSQCLTWLILPLMQSYSQAGDFNVLGKLKSAVIDNAIYYGSYATIFLVLLFYIAASPNLHLDGPKLKLLLVTTSNTWGLCLLVLLLGYGLVEVPRSCWTAAKRGFAMNLTYFKASKLHLEKCEAEDTLEDILEDIKKLSHNVGASHPLRKNLDIIIHQVPVEVMRSVTDVNPNTRDHPVVFPTEKSLVKLHREFKKAVRIRHRTSTQWLFLVDTAVELEDVTRNEKSSERYFKTTFQTSPSYWRNMLCTPCIEWYWKCLIRVWILRAMAVIFTVLSVFVVWSEVTFFNKQPPLSLFAIFVNLAKANYDYFVIEVVSCLTIAYLCVCAYYTIFKVRVLNYYYLAAHHQTDEYSLIFSGMLLCRLTPPLCLNFLGLVHLDSHITSDPNVVETSFTQIMGHMDVIPFISNGFNIYFPIGILVLCLATYFHVGSRFLHVLGFQQFVGDDEMTNDLIDEGRELIKREKRKRHRDEGNETRRRQLYDARSHGADQNSYTARSSWANKDNEVRLNKEDSGEINARAELLRDVEPVDYTCDAQDGGIERLHGGQRSAAGTLKDSFVQLYQGEGSGTRYSSWSRTRQNEPPRGIFDDI